MREPKFRGFSNETNNWHYGYGWFEIDYTEDYLLEKGIEKQAMLYTDGHPIVCEMKSMGEYTGLKDKHGKEIYEGDVVTFKYDTRTSGGYTRLIHNAAIEYGGEGGDYMRAGYTFKFKDARGNEVVYDLDWLKVRNIEVIGNIYENPELLEETA